MSVLEAFRVSDSILLQGVQGISDLIVMPGLINVDFADVRAIMKDAGSALMGIGIGTGEGRAVSAAKAAISSSLLELSVQGATGILFNVIGGKDLTMKEVDEAAKIITEAANADANIIYGTTIDESMTDQIKITVIATGFDTEDLRSKYGIPTTVEKKKPEQEDPMRMPISQEDTKPETKDLPGHKWPQEDTKDEDGNQYDIPAFLRGR